MIFLSINQNVATFGYIVAETYTMYRRRIDSYGIDSSFVMHQDLCVYLWCSDKLYTFLDKA